VSFFTLAFMCYIANLKLLRFLYSKNKMYVTPRKSQLFLDECSSELILPSSQTGTRRLRYFDTVNQRNGAKFVVSIMSKIKRILRNIYVDELLKKIMCSLMFSSYNYAKQLLDIICWFLVHIYIKNNFYHHVLNRRLNLQNCITELRYYKKMNEEEKETGNKLLSRYFEQETERKRNMHRQLKDCV